MKSFKGGLFGCLGVGAAIILVIIVLAAIGSAMGKSTAPGASSTATATATGTPRPTAVLLDVKGNGIKSTARFNAPSEWTLAYSWSCSNGFTFDMYVQGDASDIISNNNSSGNDVANEHSGGSVYLSINSPECTWHVTASG